MSINRRRGKYILVHPSVEYYSPIRHCDVLPRTPSEMKNLFPHLLGVLLEHSPQQSALLGWGADFLAETNSLTQSTTLFLEKQPTSNVWLIQEWDQAAPEIPLADENSTTDLPMHPWWLLPRAPDGIGWGWCQGCLTASLLPLLNPASFPPFQSLDLKRPPY